MIVRWSAMVAPFFVPVAPDPDVGEEECDDGDASPRVQCFPAA